MLFCPRLIPEYHIGPDLFLFIWRFLVLSSEISSLCLSVHVLKVYNALLPRFLTSCFVPALTKRTKSSENACRCTPWGQSCRSTSSATMFHEAGPVQEPWEYPCC
ncbi:hypothetical protein AVEN_13008-1 [Araneus ventricosus]|uniref:Uncharacterized protein n=1 Tax=Araneus ventricosus TaxID=182803 RepID=A0A4Y2HM03_ARAVE|nr:hypothetical protein AVEN_13008-1 [Araneus ventricosus]